MSIFFSNVEKEEVLIFHIFIFLIMMLLVPLMMFIILFFHKLCRKEATEDTVLKLTDLLERYLFPQSQVMLSTKIGKGVFGTIYKGYAHKILHNENETLVAIKEVKGTSKEADNHIALQKVNFFVECIHHWNWR